MISEASPNKNLVSNKKVSSGLVASFSASILETICHLESNKVTKSIHHRVRELGRKLATVNSSRKKLTNTKKYLEGAIEISLEIREVTKELEVLAMKIGKLHDKIIMPDIKNAIHIARAAGKSALESIKVNKKQLLTLD